MARNVATTVIRKKDDEKEYMRQWYLSRKDIYKDRHLQKTYGISLDDFLKMLTNQDYSCAICTKDLTNVPYKNVHIDHCHETGKIRGVLCQTCNMGMGMFEDKIDILKAAIAYLEKSNDA